MDIVQFVDSIPADVVADIFDRTVANSFGTSSGATASMRPRWGIDVGTAANFSVSTGTARIALTAAGSAAAHHTTLGVTVVEFDKTLRMRVPAVATGAPLRGSVFARYTDPDNHYRADAIFETAGTITFRIARSVATVGTTLTTVATGLSYTANSWWRVRFQHTGGSTWRAKIWADGGAEPGSWTATATEAPQLPPGRIGVGALRDTGNSNGTVTFEFDDYTCTPAPSVRLDLNDDLTWGLNYDGTRFPPPRLDYAAVQTLLRDGGRYPASAYIDRTLRLRLDLHTSTVDGSATEVQKLAREVNRAENVLRWQIEGMTEPLYFRTIRSPLGEPTEFPGGGNLRVFDVELLAEPFGWGPKQILPPSTVNNDPAAGSNQQQFDIPAALALGDVDTPLIVRLPGSVVNGARSLVAVRSRDLTGLRYDLQCETGTNGTDTTALADAALSGGNGKRCTFATLTTMTNRVTFTAFPGSTLLPRYRGKYRALLRCRRSVGADSIGVRLRWGGLLTTDSVDGETVGLAGITTPQWVDLGQFQLPPTDDPIMDGYSGTPIPVSGVSLAIQAERVSGTGNLDLDVLAFVPCDETTAFLNWASVLGTFPDLGVIDGPRDKVYGAKFAGAGPNLGAVADHAGISLEGTWPRINPGVDNRVFVLPTLVPVTDSLATTVDIAPEYWPAYLYTAAP